MRSLVPDSISPTLGPPPSYPWVYLDPRPTAPSYLSFYYVSPISALPVREVNRIAGRREGGYVADCKSDPNVETGTFGLFSTCQAQTRSGVVANRSPFVFFFGLCRTGAGMERCVSGYYEMGWYAHGGTHRDDFCLAARRTHFVRQPIPFSTVNRLLGTNLTNRNPPRVMCKIDSVDAYRLAGLLNLQEDITAECVAEVRRLELINAQCSGGRRYINFGRTKSFEWDDIRLLSTIGVPSMAARERNGSPTGLWSCGSCNAVSPSQSRLKLCPECGESGTLRAHPPH